MAPPLCAEINIGTQRMTVAEWTERMLGLSRMLDLVQQRRHELSHLLLGFCGFVLADIQSCRKESVHNPICLFSPPKAYDSAFVKVRLTAELV